MVYPNVLQLLVPSLRLTISVLSRILPSALVLMEESDQKERERELAEEHPIRWGEGIPNEKLISVPTDSAEKQEYASREHFNEADKPPSPKRRIGTREELDICREGNRVWTCDAKTSRGQRPIDSPYLTVEEAAEYCRCEVKTIYNHKSNGKISTVGPSRPLLFRKEELDRWLREKKKRGKN